jgi:hypothetical protein
MFKKGAAKLSEILKEIQISKTLELDLGNNSLSDEGIKLVLDTAKQFK